MPNRHGDFIWYELMTSDVEAAADFYGAVVGWQSRKFEGSPVGYRLFSMAGTDVAGFMRIPTEAASAGARPAWFGYVGVDDVDRMIGDIVKAGGKQHMPPTDIPDVGRLAMLTDPQGVAFYIMRGASSEVSTSFSQSSLGHCHWNELATSDPAAAFAFYGDRFGWQKGDAVEMDKIGPYQFITHHGDIVGGIMKSVSGGPPPLWTFYFGVADIDAVTKVAKDRGAAIHHGPAEVPGGAFITIAGDPQGAIFGLVGRRNS